MNEKWVIRFLVQETIKKQKRPKGEESDRLWDAIWKAHRDTMTGARTGNISEYCTANANGKHTTLDQLYQIIQNTKTPLCSEDLIREIEDRDKSIEFPAIQKLVNMTLKYIIILNLFENIGIEVDEENCDCPIDSIILDKLHDYNKMHHSCWTSMKKEEYDRVQDEIEDYLRIEHPDKKGNVWFDFLMWRKD